jgi:hypothetical protein
MSEGRVWMEVLEFNKSIAVTGLFVVLHVDGARLCLWTAATNGPIVHPPGDIYEYEEPWWNDTDRGKPKNSDRNLSQFHFVHYKSHMDWTERERGPPR